MPPRQLRDLPTDELRTLADELGLDIFRYSTRHHLVLAVHERHQLIAALDRDAMLDVIKWGRRPLPLNAPNEQMAKEIVRIKSMRFDGLSHDGLVVLAKLRGVTVRPSDDVASLTRKLKRQESFFAKLSRKRRSFLGSIVSNIIGDTDSADDYQFLPPEQSPEAPSSGTPASSRPASLKEEIEEAGLLGGIAGRIKKSADFYLNQKLDEIEARIDRKLSEIDQRLSEWRDKEVANRLRILKITLWASLVVAIISLLYSYLKVYFPSFFAG